MTRPAKPAREPVYNLTGKRFGRLTALHSTAGPAIRTSSMRGAWWMVRCECGLMIQVLGRNLRAGKTKSCGCMRAEMSTSRLLNYNEQRRNSTQTKKTHP